MAAKNERTGATMLQTIPMLTQSQKGLFSLARLQGHAFKSAMRYQIEALSFLKHRCEQDMKLADDLLASDDFNDAFDVYTNYCQNAQLDYSREAAKVTSIGSRVAADAAKELHKGADAATGDLAAQTAA
ncbi:MAG: phasin family protein [Aliihoeflea sp.]|uniref:phasin family protein n=1 Tax=Aliihoeflea sp. TaxID=2608088 RepID=UPI004037C6C0